MTTDSEKAWVFERLKCSLQGLAAPFTAQLAMFPKFVNISDELALDYDHFQEVVIGNYRAELDEQKLTALAAINRHLDTADPSVWCDLELLRGPFWAQMRLLALNALQAFGWPLENPPKSPDAFIPAQS